LVTTTSPDAKYSWVSRSVSSQARIFSSWESCDSTLVIQVDGRVSGDVPGEWPAGKIGKDLECGVVNLV
jgi:hypothetical protein